MIELDIKKENILKILNNLSKSDAEEMELFYKKHSKDDLIDICLNDKKSEIYIIGLDYNTPIAIGGIYKCNKDNKTAQIWLLSSEHVKDVKIEFLKYLKSKITYFKTKFNVLYNTIYKSNFKILKFLKRCGFKVQKLQSEEFKLFYFKQF